MESINQLTNQMKFYGAAIKQRHTITFRIAKYTQNVIKRIILETTVSSALKF